MKPKSLCKKERESMIKMNNLQIPYRFKKWGYILGLGAFALMLLRKYFDIDHEYIKEILRSLFLLGLLVISISKDKVEDEFIENLRAKSYRFAFIVTIMYALIQPYIEYFVDFIINKVPKDFGNFGYFQVLSFMLFIQILFFEQLKKFHN